MFSLRRVIPAFLCLVILSLPAPTQAALLPIGSPCSTNSDCLSGDCEDSDLEQTNDDFCVCDDEASCRAEYGQTNGEIWTCKKGSDATHNLHYCQSNQRGITTPVTPGSSSGFDILTDSAALQVDEIKNIIKKPQPRIHIPGVQFSNPSDLERLTTQESDGNTYLHLPFLGEYVAALYRYSVIIIGVLAVVFIVVRGFQITMSGGDTGKIDEAKTGIQHAVMGLILAVGSYVILYTINPDLVRFKNLKVLYVPRQTLAFEEDDNVDYTGGSPGGVTKPSWTAETFDCNKRERYLPVGVMPVDKIETYTCPLGVNGTIRTIAAMKDPVCQVGQLLAQQGYAMQVTDSYRPFADQVRLWCEKGAELYPNTTERRRFFAVPGYSNHGHGSAIDVHLMQDGKRLYGNVTSKTQCDIDPAFVKILADTFYTVSPKFKRLSTEVWHFEYDTKSKSVGKFDTLPSSCPST